MQHFQNAYSEGNKPESKSSTDLASDAARLQEELAKVRAAREALLAKSQSKRSVPPPPPPPPPTMGVSAKHKKRR